MGFRVGEVVALMWVLRLVQWWILKAGGFVVMEAPVVHKVGGSGGSQKGS